MRYVLNCIPYFIEPHAVRHTCYGVHVAILKVRSRIQYNSVDTADKIFSCKHEHGMILVNCPLGSSHEALMFAL